MRNALLLLRSLTSVVILPVTMTVVLPLWVVRRWGAGTQGWPLRPVAAGLLLAAGGALLLLGLVLVSTTIVGFATVGRGTLAPWDPPRRLVMAGVYRHVRNPMISGVVLVQLAEALLAACPDAAGLRCGLCAAQPAMDPPGGRAGAAPALW